MDRTKVDQIVEEIFSFYETHTEDLYIGEPVTITQHSLQAAWLAKQDQQSSYVVLAAFLHDIGHLLGLKNHLPQMATDEVDIGTVSHELIGGAYLRGKGFPEELVKLVESHVQAKRYRVAVDPDYELSPASATTLAHQGGKMDDVEVDEFNKRPDKLLALKIRDYDEQAKDPNAVCPPLDHYRAMCRELLLSQPAC